MVTPILKDSGLVSVHLLVGYYHRGKLVYAGKVGTGFDDATLERLSRRLRQLHARTSPFAVNGLPRLGVH